MLLQLRELNAKYFRSFSRGYLKKMNPITVLIGKNNAGKSNIADVVRFLKDGSTSINSAVSVRGADTSDIILKKNQNIHAEIELLFETDAAERDHLLWQVLGKEPAEVKGLGKDFLREVRYYLSLRGDLLQEKLSVSGVVDDSPIVLAQRETNGHSGKFWTNPLTRSLLAWNSTGAVIPSEPTLASTGSQNFGSLLFPGLGDSTPETIESDVLDSVRRVILDATTLGPTVAVDARKEPVEVATLDTEARTLVQVLYTLSLNHPDTYEQIETAVRDILPDVGQFRILARGDKVTFGIEDEKQPDTVYTYEQLSQGIRRTVAVVTAALTMEPGDLLVVEEPESNLHPSAQDRLIALLRSCDPSCRVILTTHSPTIASGVPIEWLYLVRRAEDGASDVEPVTESTVGLVIDELGIRPSCSLEKGTIGFVEGKTDVLVYETFARRLHLEDKIQFLDMEGAPNAERYANAKVLQSRRAPYTLLMILDGDRFRKAQESKRLGALQTSLGVNAANLLVLKVDELEVFLLNARAICEAYPHLLPRLAAVERLVEASSGKRDAKGNFERLLQALRIPDEPAVAAARVASSLGDVPPEVANLLADACAKNATPGRPA